MPGEFLFFKREPLYYGFDKSFLKEHDLQDRVFFHGDLCDGLCEQGPILKINGEIFRNVTSDNVYDILSDFFSREDIE